MCLLYARIPARVPSVSSHIHASTHKHTHTHSNTCSEGMNGRNAPLLECIPQSAVHEWIKWLTYLISCIVHRWIGIGADTFPHTRRMPCKWHRQGIELWICGVHWSPHTRPFTVQQVSQYKSFRCWMSCYRGWERTKHGLDVSNCWTAVCGHVGQCWTESGVGGGGGRAFDGIMTAQSPSAQAEPRKDKCSINASVRCGNGDFGLFCMSRHSCCGAGQIHSLAMYAATSSAR